jgi:hypothetical protein
LWAQEECGSEFLIEEWSLYVEYVLLALLYSFLSLRKVCYLELDFHLLRLSRLQANLLWVDSVAI